MGVTVHYTLITRDPATVIRACRTVAEEAKRGGYEYEEISTEGRVLYMRNIMPLRDTRDFKEVLDYLEEKYGGFRALDEPLDKLPEDPPFAFVVLGYPDQDSFMYAIPWLSLPTYGSYARDRIEGAPTSVEGVIVYPPKIDDKYTAESLDILFYKVGRWYICNGFCKTQPFTMDEVEPNIRYHKWICGVLRKVIDSSPLWWHTYVSDEGDYYETLDESKLREAFTSMSIAVYMFATALDKMLEKADARFSVSVGGKVDVRGLRRGCEELRGEAEAGEHEEGAETEEEEYGYGRQTTLDEFSEGEKDG
jgi:hypothetical protein